MILVTGAAGKTGRAILEQLTGRGVGVRAWVRRSRQESRVRALGAREVVVGDFRDSEAVREAVRGVRSIYHICPNMSRDEEAIGNSVIAAAHQAGARLVYHSVLLPRVEEMPHHWRKAQVEDALQASGLVYTILQAAAYMQNVLQHRESITERDAFPVPYAADSAVAMVDLEDVAAVAARVLTEEGHDAATYELCSDELLDQSQVARALSERLGRRIRLDEVARADWAANARQAGLSDDRIDDLLGMFEYYERHGLQGDPGDLERLLGRRPTTFAEFLTRELIP